MDPARTLIERFGCMLPEDITGYLTPNIIKLGDVDKDVIIKFLKSADHNILKVDIIEELNHSDLKTSENELVDFSGGILNLRLKTQFIHHDINEKTVPFDLLSEESNGTKNLFDIAGLIFISLNSGSLITFDELDSALHPYLVRKIIQLFTNKETNPNGAQLIFATHDVTVMDKTLLRPNEIYFTEKDKETFETKLFSLSEFKGVGSVGKNDRGQKLYKDYLDGRFGAVPEVDWDGGL